LVWNKLLPAWAGTVTRKGKTGILQAVELRSPTTDKHSAYSRFDSGTLAPKNKK